MHNSEDWNKGNKTVKMMQVVLVEDIPIIIFLLKRMSLKRKVQSFIYNHSNTLSKLYQKLTATWLATLRKEWDKLHLPAASLHHTKEKHKPPSQKRKMNTVPNIGIKLLNDDTTRKVWVDAKLEQNYQLQLVWE